MDRLKCITETGNIGMDVTKDIIGVENQSTRHQQHQMQDQITNDSKLVEDRTCTARRESDAEVYLREDGSISLQNISQNQQLLRQQDLANCRFKLIYLLAMFWGPFLAIGSGYLLANLYKTGGQHFKLELIFTALHLVSTLFLIPQPANEGLCRLWLALGIPWMVASLGNVDRKEWAETSRPWTLAIMCFSVIWMLTFLVIASTDDYRNMFTRRKKPDREPLVRYCRPESLHIDAQCGDGIYQKLPESLHIDAQCGDGIYQKLPESLQIDAQCGDGIYPKLPESLQIDAQGHDGIYQMETQGKERLF